MVLRFFHLRSSSDHFSVKTVSWKSQIQLSFCDFGSCFFRLTYFIFLIWGSNSLSRIQKLLLKSISWIFRSTAIWYDDSLKLEPLFDRMTGPETPRIDSKFLGRLFFFATNVGLGTIWRAMKWNPWDWEKLKVLRNCGWN